MDPKAKDAGGDIELLGARFAYPVDHMGGKEVMIGGNVYGQGYQGIAERIVQTRNGAIRVYIKPNVGDGPIRCRLMTPPYAAEIKI